MYNIISNVVFNWKHATIFTVQWNKLRHISDVIYYVIKEFRVQ